MPLTLRDYQEKSQVILRRDSSGLDGSDMGTGKTLTGVERVREIASQLGRAPRCVVFAPTNTHRQWRSLFAEQFPSMADSPRLRIISTPHADPEVWNELTARKKTHGIYIIGWEAMRGMCPKSIQIIKKEAADRIAQAREDRRELKKTLARKRSTEEQKEIDRQRITECDEAMKLRAGEKTTTKGPVPEGWVPKDPGGASRGYGTLYKDGVTLTKAAVREAMKSGDVPPWSRTGTWDLVIADESHRMSRRTSINKIAISLVKTNAKLAMSATPAGNKPEGMWSTLNWLWPQEYRSFWDWAEIFLEIEDSYISNETKVQVIVGEKDPGATWSSIPCKVRHLAADVRGQLPDVIERVVEVDMTAEQRRIYDEFADQSLAWIDDHPVGEPLPLSQRVRLRQAALGHLRVAATDPRTELDFNPNVPQPKLDMIKDILTDLPPDEPVMIYTAFKKWAYLAAEALTKGGFGEARVWTGDQSSRQRDNLKDHEFGRSVRIIVAQLQSISEGTDGLQRYGCCEIWACPSEDGLINTQAQGRLHRDGQTRPVQRWLLHSVNSIDTDIDASLRARRAQMKKFYRDRV